MTSVKPPRKVTKGMLTGKEIQGRREGDGYHIRKKGHVLSGVEKCHSSTWWLGMLV